MDVDNVKVYCIGRISHGVFRWTWNDNLCLGDVFAMKNDGENY